MLSTPRPRPVRPDTDPASDPRLARYERELAKETEAEQLLDLRYGYEKDLLRAEAELEQATEALRSGQGTPAALQVAREHVDEARRGLERLDSLAIENERRREVLARMREDIVGDALADVAGLIRKLDAEDHD